MFDFADPVVGAIGAGGETGDDFEDHVAETTDVEDVLPLKGLRGGVWHQVDADQPGFRVAPSELFPLGHHRGAAIHLGVGPGLVVGDEDNPS